MIRKSSEVRLTKTALTVDRYPPHLIPGMSIVFHTSASSGKDGRILLSALGLPFQSGGIGK